MRITNRYVQMVLLALWIVVVIFLFKWIPERRVAAAIAGAGFVLIPIFLGWVEFKSPDRSWVVFGSHVQFLVLFGLPVFFSRILFWNEDFGTFHFFGVPAPMWHRYSSWSYALILAALFFALIQKSKSKAR
jgi:hypothetical protein